MTDTNVPLIDIAPYLAGDEAAKRAVAAQFGAACATYGFLMIAGHGVPAELLAAVMDVCRRFFDLPVEEKRKLEITGAYRGWRPLMSGSVANSRGGANPPDLRENFVAGPPTVPDRFATTPEIGAKYYAPNLWPAEPADMPAVLMDYYSRMSRLARDVMRIAALALELPETFFDDKVDAHITQLVAANYPEQTVPPEPGQLRAGAHSDYGSFTFLLTEDKPGGLQVRTLDGAWLDVTPVPGAFIVNLGDLMAQWTNDRWRSTLHRVVNPPASATSGSRRQSLVFFHQPNHDAMVECLPSCLKPGELPKYAPVSAGEHLHQQLAKAYAGITPVAA